jgi:crotonobetainyl-CoA:carnitine CoA-transferase CaiB-like acyl-CoA transferase
VIRPAVEKWAADKTKLGAAHAMNAEGIAAGPVNTAEDVIADPHVAARNMLVEVPRTDSDADYLVPGNPVKLSKVSEGPELRVPWVGEHTDDILRDELGLSERELDDLRAGGIIT